MKFEDFLMQRGEEQQRKLDLEEEVLKLQVELDEEEKLNKVLQCALYGPVVLRPSLSSSMLPLQVQVLLAELAVVEEEIIRLEKKIEELKLFLYLEKKQTRKWEMHQLQQQRKHLLCRLDNVAERSRRCKERSQNQSLLDDENSTEKPNRLSEELIKCLIGIFLKLNKPSANLNCEDSVIVPKLTLSCINSKGIVTKTSIIDESTSCDPYGIVSDLDGITRDVGPYKNFIQFTRNSLDMSHDSECFPAIGKLRVLMLKLSTVDLSFLTYKQKLAFWINIYNASIMHAFLQNGLPSKSDELLALMNKAVLNVGGIVLNALAVEHFILRHPCISKNGSMDEKEMLLRHAYGLGYPEPNVTFALCRGSWSSPALRVYTAEDVVNEMGRARMEYLEASVGITSKKKILVPKLLQWHMRDFADDMESLLEWIYSQLPRSGSLKRSILECLNGDLKSPIVKMVEIQPYESEFRYLLSL